MKHLGSSDRALFERLCTQANLDLDERVRSIMLQYLDAVIDANRRLNLTRITDSANAVRLHLIDSLLAVPEVESAPGGNLVDLGTGAGFPGVPLCLATGRSGLLLDSVGKKAREVESMLADCALGGLLSTAAERAETMALVQGGCFSVATARAVSSLASLVELAAPLLSSGGRLVALKGLPTESELSSGARVAEIVGLNEVSRRQTFVPGGGEIRTIVVYERCGDPRIRLPRRPGQAQRAPLA